MLNLYKLPEFHFPEGFLWGSGTAGHQIEGNNFNSHWCRYEETVNDPDFERSGLACNSWEMYDKDIEILKQLGHQAYRFSIEWSRIEPSQGQHDTKALNRYLDMLTKLKEAGIHTCVTLLHFTYPIWFDDLGGFSKEENISCFLRHIDYLVPKIAHLVDSWIVMNEINLCGNTPEAIVRKRIQLKALALGATAVKQYSKAPVSSAHAYVPRVPLRPDDEIDRAAAGYCNWLDNLFFFHAVRTGEILLPGYDAEYLPDLKTACDFWGINYYHRGVIDARRKGFRAKHLPFNSFLTSLDKALSREFCPETFVHLMGGLTDKPIWITENGFPADSDEFRIIYMMQQFEAMRCAMELYHADIRAYLHWSLLDNYEWGSYAPHFGLVSVDRKTFERTPKSSAWFYKEVIENNGFSGDLFAKYTPALPKLKLRDFDGVQAKIANETQA